MPRRPRLAVPGCIYHVLARGIDGMDIFCDDQDRERFLGLFSVHAMATGVQCYAWALMSNHYHFVVRASAGPLSTLMKPLNSGYARYFNKRVGRRGYLYQDRFKSLATQDQLYLEELIRYVHLNPVRAGTCRNLSELGFYRWSGHAALMGTHHNSFQDTATVLRRFGREDTEARKGYCEFLQQGIDSGDGGFADRLRPSSRGTTDRTRPALWVIGDRDFVRRAIADDKTRRARIARFARDGWDVGRVCEHVAAAMGIEPSHLLERGRGDARSTARKIVAFLAHRQLEIPVSEVARHLGIGQPAVSAMMAQGRRLARELGICLDAP